MTHLVKDVAVQAKLDLFVTLFAKWNDKINLSAARTRPEILEHVRDSLPVIGLLQTTLGTQLDGARILDVGSGGGFPVVIAALALPSCSFVALEPVHKKQAFLRTAARELGLPNLDARAERLEDHDARDYDVAMSRATMDLRDWLGLALAHVRVGGHAIGFEAQRRDDLPDETVRHPYALDGKQRALVIVEKKA